MKKYFWILALFLIGFSSFHIMNTSILNTSDSPKKIIKTQGTIVHKSQSELINDSSVIIKGTVKEILPSKWSNPGFKKGSDISNILQTDISINVDEVYKGVPYNSENIIVRIDKGYDDDTVVISDGYPDFAPGENVLLFLSIDDSDVADKNSDYYILTGMIQGKYVREQKLNTAEEIYNCTSGSNEQIKLSQFKNQIYEELVKVKNTPVNKITPEKIQKNNEALFGK